MRPLSVQVLRAVLTCFVSLNGQRVALAEPAAPAASYEETIRRALEEYSLGHWSEARVFFGRAHAQQPSARTLRGLGLSCYESRNYVEAIAYFEQALQSSEQPLTAEMRANIEQLLHQAQQLVTRVVLTLQPKAAELEVDHEARPLPRAGVLLLDPGEHELAASAQGYLAEQHTIDAQGGELQVLLRLRPIAGAARAADSSTARPLLRAAARSDLAPYIVIAAGGAALIAGGVLLGIATADKHAVEHVPEGAVWSELESRYNRGRSFFPVGFALMSVGLAGVAAGLTWKLWPSDNERSLKLNFKAQVRVSPRGFELSGAF